jgi:hypothetical protein
MIGYEKYAELLTRRIQKVATPEQLAQIKAFEAAQPEKCPHCLVNVRSFIPNGGIAHDVANCPKATKVVN